MMALLVVFGAFILLGLHTGEVTAQNPGLQIRITERGVEKAAQVAIDLISSRLNNAPLPGFSGTSGDLDYWFSGLGIRSFQKPSTNVQVSPNVGITWTGRNAALGVNGNWRFRYKKGFIRISDSGGISVSASGISFSVSFKLGKSASGQPTVRTTQCVSSIGGLDVDVSGSPLSFIYNLFINLGKGQIKDEAAKAMCDAAREAMDGDMNKDLADVEVMNPLANSFVLDYRLIRIPTYSNGHFDSYHKGEFRSTVNPVPFTSIPAPFPIHTFPSRMVNVWCSDNVINSFSFATFERGLLQTQISNSQIPSGVLRTTCQENALCLGKLFPELKNKYPNGEGELNIKATRAPTVHTSPSAIDLTLVGEINLQVRTPDGKVYPILVLSLTLNMSVNVYIDGNILRGSVASFCPVVNIKETVINSIPPNTFQALFDVFVKQFVVGSLDEIGLKGIDLPHLKNTRFSNTMLVKNEGSLMLAADVIWAPESPNTPVTPAPPPPGATRQPLPPCYNPELLTAPPPTTTTTTTTSRPSPPPPGQPAGSSTPPPGPSAPSPPVATAPPGQGTASPNARRPANSASQCTATWIVLCFCAAMLKTFST